MSGTESAVSKRGFWGGLLSVIGMSGVAGVLVAAMVTPLIAVAGVAANSTITLFESLPDYLEIQPLQQKTELYAMQGDQEVMIANFYSQNREEVSLDQVSQYVIDAAIATEDPRFYEHGGVDVISAARALMASVLSDDGAGASTITMQYVRNVRVQTAEALLDPEERDQAYLEATETTMGRKLQEMRLAIGVEKQYTKDQILQGYLNIALFGGTVYGIQSAAHYYFGKPASELSLTEAASLVATVQNPNVYRLDVEENIQNNFERRNYVLYRMLDEGKIDQATYDEAIAMPVEPNITPTNHGCQNAEEGVRYFCDYVRKVILNDPAFGETYEERLFNFQTKGYEIHTTLDLDLQATAVASMKETIPAYHEALEIGGAATMVQAGTGRILAMAQNTVFDETEAAASTPGLSAVNFNTDFEYGGSTGFQVGSTYKIFTLAEWLASGHSLNESVNAQDRTFNQANFKDSCNGPYGGSWPVSNDGGTKLGSVTALAATSNSYNTAFAAMGEKLDQCRIRDTAMALGAHRADGNPNTSNPSAILGTNEIAPLAMATAVAALANDGVSCSPIAIDRIQLHDGTPIEAPKSTCNQAVPVDVARGVNYAMQAAANGGTAVGSNPGIVPMTGKTGTTDEGIQTWVIGATTEVGMAVWVGNIIGNVSLYRVYLPAYAQQARHAVFRPIMAHAMNKYGGGAFPAPSDDLTRTVQVTIPDLAGLSIEEATQVLEDLGFSVDVGNAVNSPHPLGTVAATLPSANTRVTTGTTVTISPSNGNGEEAGITVPDLIGLTAEEALTALAEAGFHGTLQVTETTNGSGPSGLIYQSNPAAGETAKPDDTIRVFVRK